MELNINVEEILKSVEKINVGADMDETVAKEVFKITDGGKIKDVLDPFSGGILGQSKWIAADGKTSVFIPKFSLVPYVGILAVDDLDYAVKVERAVGGVYSVAFVGEERSGIILTGDTFAQTISKALIFEARFKIVIEAAVVKQLDGGISDGEY